MVTLRPGQPGEGLGTELRMTVIPLARRNPSHRQGSLVLVGDEDTEVHRASRTPSKGPSRESWFPSLLGWKWCPGHPREAELGGQGVDSALEEAWLQAGALKPGRKTL